MSRLSSRTFLLLGAALLGGSSLFAQSGFIAGTVTTEGGAPLSGMVVAAYNSEGELATTHVTGSYGGYVLSLPAATYRVLAYDLQGIRATSFYNDAGSFDTSAKISVAAGETRSGINFQLRPGVRIEGTIRSSATGAPLAKMVVSAYNLDGTRRGFQKETDSSGSYALTVPAGQYKIAAWDDSLAFAPKFYANARSFSSASTLSVTSNIAQINFSLDPGAQVSGRVVVDETSQPLSGIEVSAYDGERGELIAYVTTRSAGDFLFALPVGRYKFGAADPEGKYLNEFFSNVPSFGAAASFVLTAGEWRSGIDFSLAPQTDPPAPTTLFIPAVINALGGAGSYWRTDVWIYNPGQEELTITATYLPGSGTPLAATIPVSSRAQVEISNIVDSLFAANGLGALRLRAASPFAAVSRTFNTPSNSSEAGTFGFSIGAMDASSTMGLAVLPGIAENDAYRTNFGMMNPHEHSITVRARLYSAGGALVGDTTIPLAPLTVQQPSVSNVFGAIRVTGAYLVLSSEEGSFFSYASVVDNKSNDPTLVLPSADQP